MPTSALCATANYLWADVGIGPYEYDFEVPPMTIHTLTLGGYQVNCYIIHDDGCARCALIDPGYDAQAILSKLQELGLTLEAILLTHGHLDHVGAVKALVAATGCALWMTEGDWSQKPGPMTHFLYPLANDHFTEIWFCEDGEIISAGGLDFEVLSTPGHTWGSVCYRCEDTLFTGDTLFAGCCGRTDLPGGDGTAMKRSLYRLSLLQSDCKVYPGHGSATTLSYEKASNPYLR